MKFSLNGAAVAYDGDRGRRLADVLRDDFGYAGVKVGCNAGDCGACTVMVDGQQRCACLTPVGQVEDALVASVEGLPAYGRLSRIQKAFLKHGAAQCGFCTGGMLMAATDLLAENGCPDEAEVLEALGGVLCRCTGYRGFVAATMEPDANPALPDSLAAGRAAGSRPDGTKALAQVTGGVRFAADGIPGDALWLRVLRNPHPAARFVFDDPSGWLAGHDGIRRVLMAVDVPENTVPVGAGRDGRPVLAAGQAQWRGAAVAALLGERGALAALDLDRLPLRFLPMAAAAGLDAAMTADRPGVAPTRCEPTRCELRRGDAAAGLAQAAAAGHLTEGLFHAAALDPACIEPDAAWAVAAGEGVVVHGTLQGVSAERDGIARALGLPSGQVQLRPAACGGSFGSRPDLSLLALVALAARLSERPVALLQERPDSMAGSAKGPAMRLHARFACDRGGRLTAAALAGDLDAGADADGAEDGAVQLAAHACGPYRLPALTAQAASWPGTGPPGGACRGLGVPQAAIAHEAAMDALAAACGSDRLEFRLRNVLRQGDLLATGQPLVGPVGLAACLEALQPHWQAALARAARANAASAAAGTGTGAAVGRQAALRHGVGIACSFHGAVAGPVFAAHMVELSVDTELGLVALDRVLAAHALGRAIDPQQVAGQIRGGVAQGIGLALMEAWLPGRTVSLRDYLIPTAGDVPPIDCLLVEGPGPAGPGGDEGAGATGVGVTGMAATAPAVLGAIRHATGLRITQVPAVPHRILAGLAVRTKRG